MLKLKLRIENSYLVHVIAQKSCDINPPEDEDEDSVDGEHQCGPIQRLTDVCVIPRELKCNRTLASETDD